MTSLPQPETIYTHESDFDGFVSGVLLQKLAHKLFGETPPLKAYNYNAWTNHVLREKSAWTADLNFEQRLDRQGWVVIDHHQHSITPKNVTLIHDIEKCAGMLCYDLCKEHGIESPALDRLVHLCQVSDLFLEEHEDFDEANDYAALVKTYQFWNLYRLIDGDLEKLLDHPLVEVMRKKREVEDPIGYEWSRNNIEELSPEVGCVQVILGNHNMIVNKLLKDEVSPFPVLATLVRRANGPVNISLRSRNGMALSIAEKLQGGGHPNASGACLPKTIHHVPDAVAFLKKTLNPATTVNTTAKTTVKDLFNDADFDNA